MILGGDDKGADLKPLFEKLPKNVTIFTIGTNEKKLLKLAIQYNIKAIASQNIKNAIKNISKLYHDKKNQVALLSPAAASFDQFKSYADRGKQFKENVFKL